MSEPDPPTTPQAPSPDVSAPDGSAEIDRSLRVLREALRANRLPSTFSVSAWAELVERESEFVAELGLDAIRRARRKRCDVVSAADINEADQSIRRAGLTSLMVGVQTVGGVSSGAGITGIIAWTGESKPSTALLVLSIVGALLGAAIIAFSMGRSSSR
jgi:hypothetical protein